MIQLQRHIEILLLDNDCVIVPDFGGFVAHHVSARYSEEDNVFLPPQRTLGFNPQLRINDSLLVQSYIAAYDLSYPEALRRIEGEVEELKDTLDTMGIYTMDDIGTLKVNDEGNYTFEPCEAGVLSPELYGLGAVNVLSLRQVSDMRSLVVPSAVSESATSSDAAATDGQPSLLEFTDNEEEKSDRAIEIKMSWIRNTVAIAAAVVAFFLMTTPIANSNLDTRSMSQMKSELLSKLMPQDTNMAPVTAVVAEESGSQVIAPSDEQSDSAASQGVEAVNEEVASSDAESKQAQQELQKAKQPSYCIVLASQVKKSNAEDYVEQLHKRGYTEAEVYVHNNTVRVIFGAYDTEAEAYRQLNRMHDKDEFAEAWVYQKKSV